MAAPGTVRGTETLNRVMREETYRKGVWEIKVSLSWPNTVKLSTDQPLQRRTAANTRLAKIGCFTSESPAGSMAVAQ